MSWQDDAMIEQEQADALFYMGEAEWRDTFEERHGWAPDWDYETIKCNKTQEEVKEIYAENSGIHHQDERWDFKVSKRDGDK